MLAVLNPFGLGIWVALGLVVVFGTLSVVMLWEPDEILPMFKRQSAIVAWVQIGLIFVVSAALVAQLIMPESLSLDRRFFVTSIAATMIWLSRFIQIAMCCYVLVMHRRWLLILCRNLCMMIAFLSASGYAYDVLDDRAYAYWVWSWYPLGTQPSIAWNMEPYQSRINQVVIFAAIGVVITALLVYRKRRAATRRRRATVELMVPEQLGIYPLVVASESRPLRRSTNPRRRAEWWEWFLPLAALYGVYFPQDWQPPQDPPAN